MLRSTLFSPSWWVSTFISTLITMCFIVLIKRLGGNVPVLSTVVSEV